MDSDSQTESDSDSHTESDSDSHTESQLISLISHLISLLGNLSNSHSDYDFDNYELDVFDYRWRWDVASQFQSVTVQIIFVVNSMDLDSQPKPETELASLVSQAISFFNSMDLSSQPEPFAELISLIKRTISLFNTLDLNLETEPLLKLKSLIDQEPNLLNSHWKFVFPTEQILMLQPKPYSGFNFFSLVVETQRLDPEPKIMSLIHQILFLVIHQRRNHLVFLCPQVEVTLEQGKFRRVKGKVKWDSNDMWGCLPDKWEIFNLKGEDDNDEVDDRYFFCKSCNGENHTRFETVPTEIEHPLHPKHPLQLVKLPRCNDFDSSGNSYDHGSVSKKCYCCDEDLVKVCYYCFACDYAMNIACVEKPPVSSIDGTKWHEHTLAHFPRRASLTCDMCALVDSSSPIFVYLSCDFVVHQRCLSLPHVIRISRHFHRLAFTPSFDQDVDWSCNVCRRKIDYRYGGYSCIKEDCDFNAHSKCATQRNIWDGKDLEGKPEDIEEEVLEPFVRGSDGTIQHFSHQHHHLRLDENVERDYDNYKQCQACVTPIYFGNFYFCLQCDFTLHEECANLSRRVYTGIHPHMLTLVGGYDYVMEIYKDKCSACFRMCKSGFFYQCGEEECNFKLHVQCATVSEPLVHPSHVHPLFLTSKPGEGRECSVCDNPCTREETFNCIEECDFGLCFVCATLPQKVRYKYDKHMLTLSYGEETSNKTYWCEVCEGKLNPHERFYKCDENCCVTLHVECLIGKDFYMKPGSSYYYDEGYQAKRGKVSFLPNNHRMSRPICSQCEKRCSNIIVLEFYEVLFCSMICVFLYCNL